MPASPGEERLQANSGDAPGPSMTFCCCCFGGGATCCSTGTRDCPKETKRWLVSGSLEEPTLRNGDDPWS